MKSDEKEVYLKQFKAGLQSSIIRAVIISFIMLYLFYLTITIFKVHAFINILNDSEFTYLTTIGISIVGQKKLEYLNIFNFMDSTGKLMELVDLNAIDNISKCQETKYICELSDVSNYSSYQNLYKVIRTNSQGLKMNKNIAALFTYDFNTSLVLSLPSLGILNQIYIDKQQLQMANKYLQDFKTVHNNSSSSSNYKFFPIYEYLFATFMIQQYSGYELICQWLTVNNQITALCCFIKIEQVIFVQNKTNYYYYTNSFITPYGQQVSIDQFSQIINRDIIGESSVGSDSALIADCMQSSPLLYSKYVNIKNGLLMRCAKNDKYSLNFFGPYYTFKYYTFSTEIMMATRRHNSLFQSRMVNFNFYISSNSTYYEKVRNLISQKTKDIRSTSYSFVLVFGLFLFVMIQMMDLIQKILVPNISFIWKLCQLLKSKEEKQFNKLVDNYRPEILGFIIKYFHQYLWVFKLIRYKGKNKYKKILEDGIELFPAQEYISVLNFIHQELITLEQAFIVKLSKLKELPQKKKDQGSKYQEPIQGEKVLILPVVQQQKRLSKRRNANINLLDPDDDQLMKNISIGYRGNRGVRFSNDIQTIQIDEGPIIRKTKFAQNTPQSCETIKNDLSDGQDSMKKSDHKDSYKSLKQDEQSYTSLAEVRSMRKKQSSLKNRSLQSIHGDLSNFKLDEQYEFDDDNAEANHSQNEVYSLSREAIIIEIRNTYQRVIDHYQSLIQLKRMDLSHKRDEDLIERVNQIYELTIKKYQQINSLLLYQNQNEMINQEKRNDYSHFQDFSHLQLSYNNHFHHQLLQHADILKLQIFHALKLPVSFKNLQFLTKSKQKQIKLLSRQLLAEVSCDLQPHLDPVIIRNACLNLTEEKTISAYKRHSLQILISNLDRYYTQFSEDTDQLRLVKQFYNSNNKKFYFLTSINSLKPFNTILTKFFQTIDNFDLLSVYDLEQDSYWEGVENEGDIPIKGKRISVNDKLKYLLDLQSFMQLFGENENQDRCSNSTKTINKKLIYQKQFYQLLKVVEKDDIDFSKYIVILLGQEHGNFWGETEDSSSNANHRPYQQKIHQQITKIVGKGYFHIILIGFQLSAYPSRYGRLKRYVKLSPELLQIELGEKDQQQNIKQLQLYLK